MKSSSANRTHSNIRNKHKNKQEQRNTISSTTTATTMKRQMKTKSKFENDSRINAKTRKNLPRNNNICRNSNSTTTNSTNSHINNTDTTNGRTQKHTKKQFKGEGKLVDDKDNNGDATIDTQYDDCDVDEIQWMVRNMCEHAFDNRDFINNNYSSVDHHHDERRRIPSIPVPVPVKKEQIYDNIKSIDQNPKFKFSNCNDYTSPPPKWSLQDVTKEKNELYNHTRMNNNNNTEMKKKLQQDVHTNINQHLQSLLKTETDMKYKFQNAKKQIYDCIQVLESHQKELMKKEIQYFDELNHCRRYIFSQAQIHFDSEIFKFEQMEER